MQSLFDVKTKLESVINNGYSKSKARTGGAFGNKSKYQKSLERQAELRRQIAEFRKQAKQAEEAKQEKPKAKVTAKKKVEKKKQENATTATE